jgi:hypothetical protein
MNQTNLLKKLSSLGIATFSAIITVGLNSINTKAANIFFLPSGNQLDKDDILEFEIGNNKPLTFDIFADTTNYVVPFQNAAFIGFDIQIQNDEGEYTFGLENINTFNFDLLKGPVQLINTINGTTVTPGIEPHNGVSDFGITLTKISFFDANNNFIGNDAVNKFDAPGLNILGQKGIEYNQVVELQKRIPEPSSILGLLALGTVGAASTLKCKLKPSKSADKELEKVS